MLFFSDVEEMNQRATRGNASYGEKEYYIRKYEEYLMKEIKMGYSDLIKFLVVNFIERLLISKRISKTPKGRRVLTISDSQKVLHGLGKEHSVKLKALAKDQRKIPQRYLEDILDYYYRYL